jgi:uncharacterized protein YndB with AHSA1/START domain
MTMRPHRYRLFIKATPEQVWQGITDPEFTERYFHHTRFESALEPGAEFRYVWNGEDQVVGEVLEADPPKRLVVTWRALYRAGLADEPPSRVEWTLTPAGEGMTRVDVVHGDLGQSPLTWASVKDGWVWILDSLKTLLETGEALPDEPRDEVVAPSADEVAADWHRAQAVDANNSIWDLLGKPERMSEENEELLRRAYAAAYHWSRARGAGPENEARALYMIGKAQLAVGHGELGLEYGDECLAQCERFGLVDFDLAYAHELRARGLFATGDKAGADAAMQAARAVPISDPDDQQILDADLAVPLGS